MGCTQRKWRNIKWNVFPKFLSIYGKTFPLLLRMRKMKCFDKKIRLKNHSSFSLEKLTMCEKMNQEFEHFFLHCELTLNCDQDQLKKILKPLRNHFLKQQLGRALKVFFLFAAICSAIYYIDTLNWHFCAIGRILMIKLLPIWDWTHLSKARCLIAKTSTPDSISSDKSNGFSAKDCRVCENFGELLMHWTIKVPDGKNLPDTIDVFEQTTYKFIRDKFLLRGLPVIVGDGVNSFNRNETLAEFVDNISVNMSEMVKQEPCDLETNLMLMKFASVDEAFGVLSETNDESPQWFISFRNCQFKAVESKSAWSSRRTLKFIYFPAESVAVADKETLLLPSESPVSLDVLALNVAEYRYLSKRFEALRFSNRVTGERVHQSNIES